MVLVDRRPLLALLSAHGISQLGTSMTVIALPWFVLLSTGSAAKTGLVVGVEAAGMALSSALAGPVIDRVGARTASVVADLVGAVAAALVALVQPPLWLLLMLVAVLGLSRAPSMTGRSVLLPNAVRHARTSIDRAASALDGVARIAWTGGGLLAGVLVALLGAPLVLLFDAGAMVCSALLMLVVPSARQPVTRGYFKQLAEVVRYVRQDRLVAGMTLVWTSMNLLDAAWMSVLMPVYARDLLDSKALGAMIATIAAAGLVGATLYGIVGRRLPRWQLYCTVMVLGGAARYLVLAFEPELVVILIVMAVAGLAQGVMNPIFTVVQYDRVPPELRARVFGAMSALVLAVIPVGTLLAGLSVGVLGLTGTLVTAGLLYLAITLCPLVLPVWRQIGSAAWQRSPAPST